MRGLVLFLLLFVAVSFVIFSFSFVVANINNKSNEEIQNKENSNVFEFSTFTSAVCESKADFVQCKDEVFVNCNGKIFKAVDVAECNGFKLDTPKSTGFAVFEKDWKDPRN